jgi:hypothetical protein
LHEIIQKLQRSSILDVLIAVADRASKLILNKPSPKKKALITLFPHFPFVQFPNLDRKIAFAFSQKTRISQ